MRIRTHQHQAGFLIGLQELIGLVTTQFMMGWPVASNSCTAFEDIGHSLAVSF
jgi:hypothetical protein